MEARYYDLNTYFRRHFGVRVHKLTVDAGLTCPNRDGRLGRNGCIFCNERGSGTGAYARGISITRQLEESKLAVARRFKAKKFIAYFQSFSNTYASVDHLRKLYDEALAVEDVVGLSIGTRPDCVNEAVLALLESYARDRLVWIEYGLQSAHDATLDLIRRGHNAAAFEQAVYATAGRGIGICAHIILGLPGETAAHMHATADFMAHLPVDGVKLHLLYVIRGTLMETLYRSGRYRCLEQKEYADLVCDILERLPERVVIQRLTGDPHSGEFLAPQWALQKGSILNLIKQELERRDSRQGLRVVKG
jgi:radical SAM protein (TIGR01212 family)